MQIEFICKNTVTEKVKTSTPKKTFKQNKPIMSTAAAPSAQVMTNVKDTVNKDKVTANSIRHLEEMWSAWIKIQV